MTDPAPSPQDSAGAWSSLRKRAIRGSAWWAGIYPFAKGIQLASNVILASLLSPAAFGVIALGSMVVRGIQVFSEIGLRFALIQSAREDDAFVNTAWTMQIGRGILVWIGAILLARPMADFYGESMLGAIVPVIGFGAVIQGLTSTKYVTLNRRLDEKPRALLELANEVISRGSMIVVAMIWPTAWALVVGTLVGFAFFVVVSHMLPGRRNRLAWDPESARALMKFGSWVFVGAIIVFLGGQLDKAILGKLVSDHLESLGMVGVYVIAQRVARLPLEAMQLLGGQLALPVLAEIGRTDRDRFEERLRNIRRVVLRPALAMCLGVIVFSPSFFDLFYDERYAAARWMAPLFSISVWMALLDNFMHKALLGLGRTRALAVIGGLSVGVSIAAGLLGFHLAGIPGFILGQAVGALVHAVSAHVCLGFENIRVYRQDIVYSIAFVVLGGLCALCHVVGDRSESALIHWGVGLAVPILVFLVVGLWAARSVWRVVRPA